MLAALRRLVGGGGGAAAAAGGDGGAGAAAAAAGGAVVVRDLGGRQGLTVEDFAGVARGRPAAEHAVALVQGQLHPYQHEQSENDLRLMESMLALCLRDPAESKRRMRALSKKEWDAAGLLKGPEKGRELDADGLAALKGGSAPWSQYIMSERCRQQKGGDGGGAAAAGDAADASTGKGEEEDVVDDNAGDGDEEEHTALPGLSALGAAVMALDEREFLEVFPEDAAGSALVSGVSAAEDDEGDATDDDNAAASAAVVADEEGRAGPYLTGDAAPRDGRLFTRWQLSRAVDSSQLLYNMVQGYHLTAAAWLLETLHCDANGWGSHWSSLQSFHAGYSVGGGQPDAGPMIDLLIRHGADLSLWSDPDQPRYGSSVDVLGRAREECRAMVGRRGPRRLPRALARREVRSRALLLAVGKMMRGFNCWGDAPLVTDPYDAFLTLHGGAGAFDPDMRPGSQHGLLELAIQSPPFLQRVLNDFPDADVNGGSEPPLHAAIRYDQRESIELLLEQPGLNVNARNDAGETALHAALGDKKNAEFLRLFLAERGKLGTFVAPPPKKYDWYWQEVNENQQLARERARREPEFSRVIDVNVSDHNGKTPLYVILGSKRKDGDELAHLLLDHGADPTLPDVNLCYPLHRAAQRARNADVIGRMVELGADPDVKNPNRFGRTPAHFAASKGHMGLLRALQAAGADVRIKDLGQKDPADLYPGKDKERIREMIGAGGARMVKAARPAGGAGAAAAGGGDAA